MKCNPIILGAMLLMTSTLPAALPASPPSPPHPGAPVPSSALSPRADAAPEWAPGCSWTYSTDQDIYFCMTLPTIGTLRLTHVSGTLTEVVMEKTEFNSSPAIRAEGNLSLSFRGTLTPFVLPIPISVTVTAEGNSSEFYRDPDLATLHQSQHVEVDLSSYAQITVDTAITSSPPLQTYEWPLEAPSSWSVSTEQEAWSRTTGSFGTYESTTLSRLSYLATLSRMEEVTVPAGTFSCYNITNNGTATSGQQSQPYNETLLYSARAANVAVRTLEPMAGLVVRLGLSGYRLNRAPRQSQDAPSPSFPEDTVDTSLNLNDLFADPDGDALRFTAFNASNLGVAIDNTTGTVTLTPPGDWSGREVLRFKASDINGAACSTDVQVTVSPVNDAPVLVLPLPDIIMDEDTADGSLNLTPHFADADFPYYDRLGFSFFDNGSISVSVAPNGTVILRPFRDWSGLGNITFLATDTGGANASGVCKVAVLNTPDPPVALCSTHAFSIPEDTSLLIDLSERFWDPDLPYGDYLDYSVGDAPPGFSIDLDGSSGRLNLTPPGDFNGRLDITFIATDRSGINASERVRITVMPVNDPPRILASFPAGGSKTLLENSSADFSLAPTDVDSPTLSTSWYLDGQLIGTGANCTYSAGFDSAGSHNLTAVASDGESNVARTWDLTVTNVNRPPEGVRITSPADGANLQEGQRVTFSAEAADPDRDPLTFVWKDTDGKVLGGGSPLELNGLSRGKHLITLEVSDRNSTVTATVTLSVSPPPSGKTPGFEGTAFISVVAVLLLLLDGRRKKQR